MGEGAFTLAMYEGNPKWPLTTVTGFGAGLGPRSLGGTNVRPPLVTPSATAVLGTTLITASSALDYACPTEAVAETPFPISNNWNALPSRATMKGRAAGRLGVAGFTLIGVTRQLHFEF